MNSNVELSAREDYFISGRKSCFKRSNFRAECCLLYKLTISVTRTYQMWKAIDKTLSTSDLGSAKG